MVLLLAFAFVAGVLTVLSPCVLPVIPLLLGAGGSGDRRRLVGLLIGFGATFVLTTVVLASVLAAAGLSTDRLRILSALVLAAFGLTIALPRLGRRFEHLASLARAPRTLALRPQNDGGLIRSLALGSAIGFVWAPCVGPIMAATIAASLTSGPSVTTAVVALAYVAGASMPLAGVGLAGRRAVLALGSAERRNRLIRTFGAVTVAGGLAIATGLDVPLQTAAAGLLPAGWGSSLTAVEQQPAILEELDVLRRQSPSASAASGTAGATPHAPEATPATGEALPPPIGASLPDDAGLEDLGPAPELSGITDWINSRPLSVASLRGKVVLIHFWTFGCINCIHVQRYVKAWYERYADAGFVVVGVHTPELSFERSIDNLRDAVAKADVRFPVAFDPSFDTWNAYRNQYWPAFYFVDRAGRIRHVHFGEGDYDGSERVIRELLAA